MTPGQRKQIGRNAGAMIREVVFETTDAIEVESRAGYEITRKRVLYEEILLVTFHRSMGWPYVIGFGLVALFFGTVAAMAKNEPAFTITFGLLALPFLVACVIRLVMQVDYVSIFGRRSKAVIRFPIRKRRAREVYGRICSRATEVQRAMAEPEPEVPPPADEPSVS